MLRRREMIGMRVRLQNPGDAQACIVDVPGNLVRGTGVRAARDRGETEDGIDDCRLA